MTDTKCQQCGLINRLASEICAGCGAELPSVSSATAPPINYQAHSDGPGNAQAHNGEFRITPTVGPFLSVGDALGPAISLFVKNIWLITKIVFVVFAPFEVFKALSFSPTDNNWQTVVGTGLLGLVCKALIAPSLIYALFTQMRTGVAPDLTECYRWGLNRLGKLIAVVVLAWSLQALGYILLIVPGIILGLAFELVYPMAALENRSPVEILKRSYNLTKGYRWRILGAGIVFGLLCSVINIPVTIVSAVLVANGSPVWPLDALMAMAVDLMNEATTVLSLVIYLGILAATRSE